MIYTLMGFMGAGKTSIGQKLASKLLYPFLDLDEYIEISEGKSIHSIFTDEGEDHFRMIESKYLKELLKQEKAVISLGGGTPCFNNNMKIIKEKSESIFIDTPFGILLKRLKNTRSDRPLLKGKNKAELNIYLNELWTKRREQYLKADHILTEHKDPVKHILYWLSTNKP